MQKLIEVVLLEPGLQLVARATVAPASITRRASGYGWRVEKSVAGRKVATVLLAASASTSTSLRYVQWSAEAHPSSTASWTPGPCPSWLACSRVPKPCRRAAVSTARHWSASNAPCSQNASTQRHV